MLGYISKAMFIQLGRFWAVMELESVYWMLIALKLGPVQLVATELCPSRLGNAARRHLAGSQQLALSMTAHVCLSGAACLSLWS